VKRLVVGLILGATLLSGCSFNGLIQPANPYPPTHFRPLDVSLPATVGGLVVANEPDAAKLLASGGTDSMIEAGTVFSFREGKLLRAVLEVGEMTPDAKTSSQGFQAGVVGQMGSTIMQPVRHGKQVVWTGGASRQLTYVWFKGRRMYVLISHDVQDPKALLDAVMQVLD
jgi:hypothetical protein